MNLRDSPTGETGETGSENETDVLFFDAIKALDKLSKHLEKVDKPRMYKVNQVIHILWKL
jgi:hypothetical protein